MADTKLRMSIDQRIIDIMDELTPLVLDRTSHAPNSYGLRAFEFPVPDSKDTIKFNFGPLDSWVISRNNPRDGIWSKQDKDCWTVRNEDGGLINISTYGKMCVDINREIIPLLGDLTVQVDLLKDPVYCPVCEHCGETGCCGFIGFLEKHVRNKTNCIHEVKILDDLEKWIKEEDD